MTAPANELQHLKQVSRVKHEILQAYLPPWAAILGSVHKRLIYLDCFAGPGKYEAGGKEVMGSPAIAVSVGKTFLGSQPRHTFDAVLIDENPRQIESLRESLEELKPFPDRLVVSPVLADSNEVVAQKLEGFPEGVPAFVMIDPYGHPLPIPIINRILRRSRSEVLINLMWWRINMNLGLQAMEADLNTLFGDEAWKAQPFMSQTGKLRRDGFLSFFLSKLEAKFKVVFTIKFDVEDKVKAEGVKYWLIHASNNAKAALLMKEVMYKLGDEAGTFEFSGSSQQVLISEVPREDELKDQLLRQFAGRTVTFDEVRIQTYELPFIERQYRAVLQELRKSDGISVRPVTSKKHGLKGDDLITFPNR